MGYATPIFPLAPSYPSRKKWMVTEKIDNDGKVFERTWEEI
jgi:hypothetical protein